jgi:hypothetical protein
MSRPPEALHIARIDDSAFHEMAELSLKSRDPLNISNRIGLKKLMQPLAHQHDPSLCRTWRSRPNMKQAPLRNPALQLEAY